MWLKYSVSGEPEKRHPASGMPFLFCTSNAREQSASFVNAQGSRKNKFAELGGESLARQGAKTQGIVGPFLRFRNTVERDESTSKM
jgi:hypothetical protein